MKILVIDSWDGAAQGDHFDFSIDGTSIDGWQLQMAPNSQPDLCGRPNFKEYPPFTAYLATPHSADSLTLKLISYSNEDSLNESFGFRDIQIDFVTTSSTYTSLCSINGNGLSTDRCRTSCSVTQPSMRPTNSGFCYPSSCSRLFHHS
ncbi:MAG: hypothetical protein EOO00_15050 [Chitinophagaceae bacterium]|nr:MAG: hypothetical protein EOO00_15050 [Chitinophagaceae bacterium]